MFACASKYLLGPERDQASRSTEVRCDFTCLTSGFGIEQVKIVLGEDGKQNADFFTEKKRYFSNAKKSRYLKQDKFPKNK